MWIVWMCETVAYSRGDLQPTYMDLRVELLLPKKSPKPRARVYYAIILFCGTVAYSKGVRTLKRP